MDQHTRDELEQKANTEYYSFWQAITDQNGVFKDIKIMYLELYHLVAKFGYCRLRINDNSIFIKIVEKRILREVQVTDIKNEVLDYLDTLPDKVNCPKTGQSFPANYVKEKLIKSISTYFDREKLDTIKPPEEIVFNRDADGVKFIYFKNGFLKITAKNIQFQKYDQLPGFIWETEIIPRYYQQGEEKGPVKRFFELVSGAPDRFEALKIITGYLMHNYFDYTRRALLLTDSTLDQGEANGRTGKTLYGKLVGGVLCANPMKPGGTFVEIGAKGFDPMDKFRYSDAGFDTKLIMLNDLKANFNVDYLYNDVTEGIKVNKKNAQPFPIDAKIILTSNKTVKIEGASSVARFVVFEFTDHFTPTHTPADEFKHWFFKGWNDSQYNHYYYFMALCAQAFFKNGDTLPKPRAINLDRRTLMDHTAPEFVEFVEDNWQPKPGEWYDKKEVYERFMKYDNSFAKVSQRKFTEWVKRYMNLTPKYKNYGIDNEQRGQFAREIRFLLAE